jgi:hypothetical protein
VLNAGKNKIKSIDEVRSLVSLRALILNGEDQRIEYQVFFFLMVGGIVSFWVLLILQTMRLFRFANLIK